MHSFMNVEEKKLYYLFFHNRFLIKIWLQHIFSFNNYISQIFIRLW